MVITKMDDTEDSVLFRGLTNGEEVANPVHGIQVRSRSNWVGTELLIESWMKVGGREGHFHDFWSLSGDAQTLTMEHRDDYAGQVSRDICQGRESCSSVITKIDRMKTRQGESLFFKVDVGGETVRVFGRPEELAERLEESGYDIPPSEIEAGMELHLPCLVKVGQGNNGYKTIEEFLPEAAE